MRTHRRAVCLLLTAAALPLTPLAAQDAQSPLVTTPSPIQSESPPSVATPIETTSPPTVTTPLPNITIPDPEPIEARAEPRASARTTSRAATRTPARAPVRAQSAAAPARSAAPAPAAEAPAPAAAPATAEVPPAVPPLEPAPAPAEPAPAEQGGSSTLLWAIGGLLALGLLAFFLLRRRRSGDLVRDEEIRDDVLEPAAAPVAAMPIHDEPVAAAAEENGRPWLDLVMRPRRAGVTGEEALVEFDLGVENHGTAPARDVRISTWMFPGGAGQQSEMERALVEHRDETSRPQGTIEAGAERRIDGSVALPTAGVHSDSVLPVVFAEARYVLPDGSEARTSATFAVGVPIGEELAHFDLENPSGLHDGVEARPLGEPEHQ